MIASLIAVLGCSIALIFLSTHTITAQKVSPIMYSYNSSAMFNSTLNSSVLAQNSSNFANWGQIPGAFDSFSSMMVGINSYDSTPGSNITWNSTNYVTMNMTWTMENPTYGQVEYGAPFTYVDSVTAKPTWAPVMTQETQANLNQNITTLNYDAISTMSKIGRPPMYSQAWQAATMVIDKMQTQSF